MAMNRKVVAALLVAACEVRADRPPTHGNSDEEPSAALFQNKSDEEPSALVFQNKHFEYPEKAASITETLRFITAFGTGFSTLTDVTHQLPLLTSVLRKPKATAYAFVDTWVGKNTGWSEKKTFMPEGGTNSSQSFLQNNRSKACILKKDSVDETFGYGNGMSLNAELLFWKTKAEEGADAEPPAYTQAPPTFTVSFASGHFGDTIPIGKISALDGTVTGGGASVLLQTEVDLADGYHRDLHVFPRTGASSCQSAFDAGHEKFKWANAIAKAARRNDRRAVDKVVQNVERSTRDKLLDGVSLLSVEPSGTLKCKRKPEDQHIQVGMPVFLDGADTTSVLQVKADNRVGEVTRVDHDTYDVGLECDCVPTEEMTRSIRLKVPKQADWQEEAKREALPFEKHGAQLLQQHNSSNSSNFSNFSNSSLGWNMSLVETKDQLSDLTPTFMEVNSHGDLELFRAVGTVNPSAVTRGPADTQPNRTADRTSVASLLSSGHSLGDGSHVCILDDQVTGKLLERTFHMPSRLVEGHEHLMNLMMTGHGWANTVRQCGEFCHNLIQVRIDQPGGDSLLQGSGTKLQKLHNISMWHDDCTNNPWGNRQHGTYATPRSTWCPGSVEPGIFMKVDLAPGLNRLTVFHSVYNEDTKKYEPFSNGYNDDEASMVVSGTISAYPKEKVDRLRQQPKAYTSAEAALRSSPGALTGRGTDEGNVQMSSLLQGAEPDEGAKTDGHLADLHLGSVLSREDMLAHKMHALKYGIRTPSGIMSSSSLVSVSSSSDVDFSDTCKTKVMPASMSNLTADSENLDYEAAYPWNCFSEKDFDPSKHPDIVRLSLFNGKNVNNENRFVTSLVESEGLFEKPYAKAALHLSIESPHYAGVRPDGTKYKEDFDAYDRFGTLGFKVEKDTPGLDVFSEADVTPREWSLQGLAGAERYATVNKHEPPVATE